MRYILSLAFHFLIIWDSQVHAQTLKIDSLIETLKRVDISDHERIDLSNAIAREYSHWMDSMSTFMYSQQAIEWSNKIDYDIGLIDALGIRGHFHLQRGNLNQSKNHFNQVISRS